MVSANRRRELLRAAVVGAIHGAAEHTPVSSSAHVALIPALLGWPPAPAAHAFAVSLHAGSLPGLVRVARLPPPRQAALGAVPAAAIGYLLDRRLSDTFGGRGATCAGLIAGSVLLVAADDWAPSTRSLDELGDVDALVIGIAQSLALVPGLSRLGIAVAAARALGFDRDAAFSFGRGAGLPLIAGAALLKAVRAARPGADRGDPGALIAGTAAAAATSIAAARLGRTTSIRAPALERVLLAVAALVGTRAAPGPRNARP